MHRRIRNGLVTRTNAVIDRWKEHVRSDAADAARQHMDRIYLLHTFLNRPVAGFVCGRWDRKRMRRMQNTIMCRFCDAQQTWTKGMGNMAAHPVTDRIRESINPVWEAAMRQANDLVLNGRLPR